jgi:HEAT repeat protein
LEQVAWAPGEVDRPEAVPALVEASGDDAFLVLLNACRAVANYGGDEVRSALVTALGDDDEQVAAEAIAEVVEGGREALRPLAVQALSGMAEPDSDTVFKRLTQDPDPQVRTVAVFSLGRIPDTRALPRLAELLEDEAWPRVRHPRPPPRRIVRQSALPRAHS